MNRLFTIFSENEEVYIIVNGKDKKYKIKTVLGSGGFSVVYEALEEDNTLRRIKTFNPIVNNSYKKMSAEEIAKRLTSSESHHNDKLSGYYTTFIDSENKRQMCESDNKINFSIGQLKDLGLEVIIFDPQNDITLSNFLEAGKDIPLQNLVHIAKSILAYTSRLRKNNAVHFDIKPDNILINKLTGDFLGLIDYGSAFHLTEPNLSEYEDYWPAISSGYIFGSNCNDIPEEHIRYIKGLRYCFDIFCAVKWFADEIDNRKLHTNSKGAMNRLKKFVEDIIEKKYKIGAPPIDDPQKLYVEMQNLLSAIDVPNWTQIKEFCSQYVNRTADGSIGKEICNVLLTREVIDSPLKIDKIRDEEYPFFLKCEFYEERKVISNELINYVTLSCPNVIAASVTIDMATQTTQEIQNSIARAITGKDSFDYLKNTLSEDNQNLSVDSSNNNRINITKLLLFINLRTYDCSVIENLNLCLKELLDASKYGYKGFNFILLYSSISYQDSNASNIVELDMNKIFRTVKNGIKCYYTYIFSNLKAKLEDICKHPNSTEKNSLKHLAENLANVDNNTREKINSIHDLIRLNNEIKANETRVQEGNQSTSFGYLSSFDMVMSALDHLSSEKAMAFVLMLYTVYNSQIDFERHTINKTINYHSPLKQKDIILIAERTGIIDICGVGESNGILYIKARNTKMIAELLASAVFERYSTANFSKYYELFSKNAINQSVCNEIRMYLNSGTEQNALRRFKEDLARMDPIMIKWEHGNAKAEKVKLTQKETYLAINLRLMLINSNEKYEEPASETGHYVILNESAVEAYGITNNNEDNWQNDIKTVKDGIEQSQSVIKWAEQTIETENKRKEAEKAKRRAKILCIIASVVVVVVIITAGFIYNENPKSVRYNNDLPMMIGRYNISQNLNYYYADEIIMLDNDYFFIPVENDVLYGKNYRNFVFVDGDTQTQYETEAFSNYNISNSIDVDDKDTEPTLKVQYNNDTFNCVLLKLKSEVPGTDPVHITSILNRANNRERKCDFYIVNKNNSINISIDQMPGNVSNNMEFLIRFSSPLDFTVEELDKSIYLNYGNVLLTPKSVDKIFESGIANEKQEKIYKVRFEELEYKFGVTGENVQTLRVLIDFGAAWVEKYNKKIGGINNLMLISDAEKNSFIGLDTDKEKHSLCTDAEWTTKLVKSQENIDADTVNYNFDFVINSPANSQYIIMEPPQEEWKKSYYIDNFKIVSQEGLSFSNYQLESNRYLTLENIQIYDENALFSAEATVSNGNCQFADNCVINVNNLNSFLNQNGTDSLGVQVRIFDFSFNRDNIYIHLKAEDDYPLSEGITECCLQDSVFVYGAVCGRANITATHVVEDNKYNYKKLDIIINIPVEEYLDLAENVSVMINCASFSDSAGNSPLEDTLVIGSDAFFSAPYYDADKGNSILADIIYPYNYKQNLLQGHIGSVGSDHDLLDVSTNENLSLYTRTISFSGINKLKELFFTVNGGTGINTNDGSFLPGYVCDFRSGFSVPKCRLFDGGVQAELIFNSDVDLNMLSFDNGVDLIGKNGNKIKTDMKAYRNGNRVLLTFTNFEDIPVTMNINEGIAVIKDGGAKTGVYSCRIEDHRSLGPQLQMTDHSFENNMISIRLKEKDYPLTERLNLQDLNDSIFVYGAVCNFDNVKITVSDMKNEDGDSVQSQNILINIPIEKYMGSVNDVSVMIDCTKICDSKNNPSETGTLVIGSDAFFSVPYYDTYNNTILADIVYPYNYLQNLRQGHIGSVGGFHNLLTGDANETTKPYTHTISFKGLNDFSELYFTVNGGTGINTSDGGFLPGYRCDFRSGFSIPKCRLFDNGVQAELIFNSNIDMNTLNFEGNVELRDENYNVIEAKLNVYENNGRVLLTFTNFNAIPETMVVKESLSVIQNGNVKIGGYSCEIDDKRTENNG